MSIHAPVALVCPHCNESFSESARLVRPGGESCCPGCGQRFALADDHAALERARLLRRQRRQRRDDLMTYLRAPAPRSASRPVEAKKPMVMGDVLQRLDDLLAQMESLRSRPT
ncbi:hypothetical protein [Devosia sp.]|uniref:hypothetical protein n=1 Tax=Devosia sp. TaxID=1871048 RepID=UPI003A8E17E4